MMVKGKKSTNSKDIIREYSNRVPVGLARYDYVSFNYRHAIPVR